MTPADVDYIKQLLALDIIKSPCLELGVGYGGEINKNLISKRGIEYYGTDIIEAKNVDFVVDFEATAELIKQAFIIPSSFETILCLNVLEHTFNPIKILDNIFSILNPGGTCVIITPTVWPLHSYPKDFWRINPDFYEEYCQRNNYLLLEDYFEYIGQGKIHNLYKNPDGYSLPSPENNNVRKLISRIIHKLFNTYGRGMFFPSNIATGVVIQKQC